jgi:hypothetical protein
MGGDVACARRSRLLVTSQVSALQGISALSTENGGGASQVPMNSAQKIQIRSEKAAKNGNAETR